MPIDKPLPPEILADALQDRIHKDGPAIKPGKSVLSDGTWIRTPEEEGEQDRVTNFTADATVIMIQGGPAEVDALTVKNITVSDYAVTGELVAYFDVPKGATCDHRNMDYCCAPRNCGQLVCLECGLSYDEGFDA